MSCLHSNLKSIWLGYLPSIVDGLKLVSVLKYFSRNRVVGQNAFLLLSLFFNLHTKICSKYIFLYITFDRNRCKFTNWLISHILPVECMEHKARFYKISFFSWSFKILMRSSRDPADKHNVLLLIYSVTRISVFVLQFFRWCGKELLLCKKQMMQDMQKTWADKMDVSAWVELAWLHKTRNSSYI